MYFAHRHDRQEMLPPIMPSHHLRSGRSVDKARRLPSRTPQVSSTTSLGDTTGSLASLGGYSQGSSSREWDDQRHHARHGSPNRRDPSRERRNSLRGRQILPLTAREPRHRGGPDPDGDLITTITFRAERAEARGTAETPEATLPTLTPPPTANAAEKPRSESPALKLSPRHFLRKGAGLATQEAVASVNRQRFGRRQPQHAEVEEASPPSRPPLPHINQTSERTSLRRPSMGIPTIELTRLGTDSDVLPALQRTPSTNHSPMDRVVSHLSQAASDSVAWPDSASSAADDPSPSTLEAFDGLSPNSGHAKTINVWVQEPERRGISAMQFERFFNRFCGDVIYEDLEEPKPLCLPTTLCQACVQANRADPEVKNRSKRPRETNLYAVTELIIKPETAMLGVSYSELINPDGLQVDYFISHHWAEDFGEFVQSVLRHAIVAAPEMGGLMEWTAVVYWCCAFANNQHQVELGETLQKSPFYQALNSKNCRGTVMNLNQAATALDRIWCIYEVYLTHTLDKPFTLNFKLGPLVGVVQETKEKDSWVFHIFKMLQHIDVQQADATSPDDYRKIMGEIANFQSRDGRSGPQALNRVVKAMLGSQAIFTLARRGDMGAVRRALELDADPNIPDTLGIRPLTYAAGNGHEEVVQTLIAGKANADAQKGANEVLAMFSPNRAERRRCIDFVRALDEAETGGVHSQAISRALLQHTTSRCQDLTSALDADNAELRLEVVRELRSLLHALVDHRNKLMRDQEEDQAARDPDDPASGEDERVAIGRHAKSLAPYMADPDPRVRIAVVEAVTSIKAFDLSCLKVPKRMIQEDDLHIVINSSEKLNVVHLAAMQPYPNALYMLATGVDWALDPKALRALDGLGRNIAHLAVRSGHLECLAMMVGELKLPRSSLMLKDSEGRTPVHYAALNGDSGSLRAFVDLASLTPGELTSPDNTGSHAAHLATARKYWRFLGVLVNDCGISVDALCLRDTEGRNVAHLAAANGDSQTLRYLAEKCRLPHSALEQADHWFRTPAHHAALADSAEVLALLQELGAPLHLPMGPLEPQIGAVAIVNQSNEVVRGHIGDRYLLGKVVWVDRHQKMRFEYEKGIKDTEGVEADRCDLAPTPLVLAEKFGRKEASEFLSNAWTPIVAEVSGQIQKEELMLQARRGALPSGVLVSHGAYASVEKFLQKGLLDVKELAKRDAGGCSCLHRAARTGVAEAVYSILHVGQFTEEDMKAADKQGWSVVHHAAAAGNAACLEVILQLCQLPHSFLVTPDNWGRTPAHVAAEFDAEEVIKVLAKHQAPMHETMGEPVLQDGVVALVQARENWGWATNRSRGGFSNTDRPGTGAFGMGHVKSMGGRSDGQTVGARTMGEIDIDLTEDESSYTLGRVNRVFAGDQVSIKHESGFREGCVELDRCTFCPMPIVLADRRGRTSAVRALLEAAWKPFAEAVASAALAVGCDPEMWEWEDVEEIFREEALSGARPAGAFVARRCEGMAALLQELLSLEVVTTEELLTPDQQGRTALHRAAGSGQATVLLAVKELSGATHEQVEALDLQGRGLLHHAALSNDAECVRTVIRFTPRPPLELAEEDSWHHTPIHLAATVDGVEAIKALIEMGVPFDKHMGPTKLEDGTVVLVQTREAEEEAPAEWQLALVRGLAGNNLTVKFHGCKETKVLVEKCEVAPTPLALAEKLGKQAAFAKLKEAILGSSRRKLHAVGTVAGTVQGAAKQMAMGFRMAKTQSAQSEAGTPRAFGHTASTKEPSGSASPKPPAFKQRSFGRLPPSFRSLQDPTRMSTPRRRFRGAALTVMAELRLARAMKLQ